MSDEEILADAADADQDDISDDDSQQSDGASTNSDDQDEDEDAPGWGDSKQDYYDADVIETEQDALDEEKEARRLQQKQLQGMTAADFGFDENEWRDVTNEASNEDAKRIVTEVLPQIQITKDMDSGDKLKLLNNRYPEFEHLSKDFVRLQDQLKGTKSPKADDEDTISALKYTAATAYMACLTMYFVILTSTAAEATSPAVALPPSDMRNHPLMADMLACRNLWQSTEQLVVEDEVDDTGLIYDRSDDADAEYVKVVPVIHTNSRRIKHDQSDIQNAPATLEGPRRRRARNAADVSQAASTADRAARIKATEADLADLDSLLTSRKTSDPVTRPQPSSLQPDDSDHDDETEAQPSARELATKAASRKSLRFYTSQIAQKANKRGAAGRGAGGDDDVPHRERLRDRQDRLQSEAQKRGASLPTRDQELGSRSGSDEDHSDTEQRKIANDVRNTDGAEYYNSIATKTAMNKSAKKALAAARAEADATGGRVVEQETIGADGKRAIGYAIEKNKGLMTLSRGSKKREARNPRVKKRLKYEEKKKKLASMKQVYKGGEGRGGYGGELTGIKSKLVRSTKL